MVTNADIVKLVVLSPILTALLAGLLILIAIMLRFTIDFIMAIWANDWESMNDRWGGAGPDCLIVRREAA